MRVMVIIKATKNSEAGVMPSEKLFTVMGKYNEELVRAGIMLAGEGLHPSSKAKRVRFAGGTKTVLDRPFAETRELIADFGEAFTPELKRREERLLAELERQEAPS